MSKVYAIINSTDNSEKGLHFRVHCIYVTVYISKSLLSFGQCTVYYFCLNSCVTWHKNLDSNDDRWTQKLNPTPLGVEVMCKKKSIPHIWKRVWLKSKQLVTKQESRDRWRQHERNFQNALLSSCSVTKLFAASTFPPSLFFFGKLQLWQMPKGDKSNYFECLPVAGKFYTLTTGANERRWGKMKDRLYTVIDSFRVFNAWLW